MTNIFCFTIFFILSANTFCNLVASPPKHLLHNNKNGSSQDLQKPSKKKSKRSRSPKQKSPPATVADDVIAQQSSHDGSTADVTQEPAASTSHKSLMSDSPVTAPNAAAAAHAQSTTDYISDLLDARINVRHGSGPGAGDGRSPKASKKKPHPLPSNADSPNRLVTQLRSSLSICFECRRNYYVDVSC